MKHNRSKGFENPRFLLLGYIYQHCSLQSSKRPEMEQNTDTVTSTQHETRDTRKKLSSPYAAAAGQMCTPTTPLTLGGHFSHSGQAKWVRRRLMNPALARHSREPIRGCKYVTALSVIGVSLACLSVGLGWVGFLISAVVRRWLIVVYVGWSR